MRAIELKPLIGRLNDVCRRALEAAAGATALRTHYNVEIEHMLIGLLDRTDTDIAAILRRWEIDPARVLTDVNRSLDRMKTGNARAPSLSPDIVDMVKDAWLLASVEHGATRVRSGHLLWALLADETLALRAREASARLTEIPADVLKRELLTICKDTAEAAQATKQADGSDTILAFFRGNQGAAINANWDITALFKWVPKVKIIAVNPYFFGDAGCIGMPLTSKNSLSEQITKSVYSGLLADAGFGANVNLKNFNVLFKNKAMRGSKPLNMKVEFPIWRNAVQPGDDYLKFRMRLSVGTVF